MQGSGSISPSGRVKVVSGTNQAFTITPAANYQISGVKVDGKSIGAVSSYTFTNVTANHTIAATFAAVKSSTSNASSSQASVSTAPSPVADAGPDQAVESSSIVTLNGSNSTDTVSGIASYKWTQMSGPKVTLSRSTAPICTFKAPNITSGMTLAFNLAVTNKARITGKRFLPGKREWNR